MNWVGIIHEMVTPLNGVTDGLGRHFLPEDIFKPVFPVLPEITKDPDKETSYGPAVPFSASIDLKTCSGYIKLPLAIPVVLIVAIYNKYILNYCFFNYSFSNVI